jgi:hypothetical protein
MDSRATESVVSPRKLLEQIIESIQCSVAFEVFSNPVTLPCGHSFSAEIVTVNANLKNCPLCRSEFTASFLISHSQK